MADFVAVIRRAVDGLSDNTPEMRVKVYERARAAVQRQLESMKPRPPEAMLHRQLEKLEVAIREVEAEHAEALPHVENEAPAQVTVAPVVQEEPAAAGHQSEPEHRVGEAAPHGFAPPQHEMPAYEPPAHEPPLHAPDAEREAAVQPAYVEVHRVEAREQEPPVPHPAHEEEVHGWQQAGEENEPVEEWHEVRRPEAGEPVVQVPVAEPQSRGAIHGEEPVVAWYEQREEHAEPVHEAWPQPAPSGVDHVSDDGRYRVAEATVGTEAVPDDRIAQETRVEPPHLGGASRSDPVWSEDAALPVAESQAELEHAWASPETVAPESRVANAGSQPRSVPVFDDDPLLAHVTQPLRPAAEAKMPAAAESFAWDANAFDELPSTPAEKPAQPVAAAGNFDDVDLFADVHGATARSAPKSEAAGDGWRELRELAGYDKFTEEDEAAGSAVPPDLDQVMASKLQGKSFRMEPKRRRFGITRILLILVGIAVVGGAGYAAWMNRAALDNMVAGLISSAPKTATVVDKPVTPATETAKAPDAPQAAGAPQPAGGTDVASADTDTVNTKFTQRLLASGDEVDEGPAAVLGQQPTAEGKSVAQQNVAAASPPAAAPSETAPAQAAAPAGTAAATAAPPATAAQPEQAASAGSTAKMFLYEERLGQTSPTAIEGSVTWSLLEEKGTDGRPEPSVQGSISVPERGLTALITFKRNSDPSLPASHLIEIVFSVPPNFEGGAIDSVQRVAMKATEQDRGDALIAVPAKITDDFHMIALNDFPDARKTNIELMRSRNWIDIPVTYRNGRRALLTMEKGPTGTEVFNKAIAEWAALGDVSSSQ